MKGKPASSSRARAAEILAICISDRTPSCIRAPPEAEMTMSGFRSSRARSAARVIFSPTTDPMLPPMKVYSIAEITVGIPPTRPTALTIASLRPVASWYLFSRSLYGLLSLKERGSVGWMPRSTTS